MKPLFVLKSVYHGFVYYREGDALDSDHTQDISKAARMTLNVAIASRCPDSEDICDLSGNVVRPCGETEREMQHARERHTADCG